MSNEHVFDTIETSDRVYTCVVDYVSKRQVMIYDLTSYNDPIIRLMVINWKLHGYHMRFSVYRSKFYPDVEIPEMKILHRKTILNSTHSLVPKRPSKKKTRITIE